MNKLCIKTRLIEYDKLSNVIRFYEPLNSPEVQWQVNKVTSKVSSKTFAISLTGRPWSSRSRLTPRSLVSVTEPHCSRDICGSPTHGCLTLHVALNHSLIAAQELHLFIERYCSVISHCRYILIEHVCCQTHEQLDHVFIYFIHQKVLCYVAL